jgi:hypothetical protein
MTWCRFSWFSGIELTKAAVAAPPIICGGFANCSKAFHPGGQRRRRSCLRSSALPRQTYCYASFAIDPVIKSLRIALVQMNTSGRESIKTAQGIQALNWSRRYSLALDQMKSKVKYRAFFALGTALTTQVMRWVYARSFLRDGRLMNHSNRAARRALEQISAVRERDAIGSAVSMFTAAVSLYRSRFIDCAASAVQNNRP